MTGKRYSEEYKNDAVRHWMETAKSAERVASELGISVWSLRRWKTAYLKKLDGRDQPDSTQMKPSETEQQREILKKAVIFFGQDSEKGSRS